MADPSLKDKIETRKKALADVMDSMDTAPKKEEKKEPAKEKKGISSKNSMMRKPWGFLAKD